jgi:hypothetical protein
MNQTTVIFVAFIQTLASIRLKGKHPEIKLKIPLPEVLIHNFYIQSAENIYNSRQIL